MKPARVFVALLVFIAFAPRGARAHPLHSTITELVEDRARGTVRATVRVFADDFTTAVRRSTKDRVKEGSGAAWDSAALAYAISAFSMLDRSGRPLPMKSCGVRRTADLLWICLEASVTNIASLKVRDTFLCELFDDQVNVVQATVGTGRRSLLFTKGDAAKSIT